MSMSSPTCGNCGAPDNGELVVCRFCRQAVNAEAQRTAIPCPNPQCGTLCRWGKQKCVACQAWLVVSCVFCGSLSPHNQSNCMQCNEAFAGAAQRKAAIEQQRMQQQNLQEMNAIGSVAAVFAGAALGAAMHHHDHSSGFDLSDVSDFDFDD